jgi:hypothetical protein
MGNAIDGLFFGIVIGTAVNAAAVAIREKTLSTIVVGASLGAALTLAIAFVVSATHQATGVSVFEAMIQGNALDFLETPVADGASFLSFLQSMYYSLLIS